jgi:hypothetical protein
LPADTDLNKVDVWFQDETRIGQQGSITRIWAKKGTRPRAVRQQQFCPSVSTPVMSLWYFLFLLIFYLFVFFCFFFFFCTSFNCMNLFEIN